MRNPAQLPAQLTFCPAQFASKKAHNFNFFSRTLSEGLHVQYGQNKIKDSPSEMKKSLHTVKHISAI